WQAMRTRGRIWIGGRASAASPTTPISKDRIVARATGERTRTAAPTERGAARRQEKNFDRTARAAPERRHRVRRNVPLVHHWLAEIPEGHGAFRRAAGFPR